MVVAVGVVSVFSLSLCHCSAHCTDEKVHTDHHHCSHVDECENHRAEVAHQCMVESCDTSLEFVLSDQQRVQGSVVVVYAVVTDLIQNEKDANLDDWRQYDLYRGFDPSCSLLRAPPALV